MKTLLIAVICWLVSGAVLWGQGLYEKEWKAIEDSYLNLLPKNGLTDSERLLIRIKEIMSTGEDGEQQAGAFVKTLLWVSSGIMQTEYEMGLEKTIMRWEAETALAKGAMQALMRSILAQIYDNYLQLRLNFIRNRSETDANFRREELRTWGVGHLKRRMGELYLLSVSAPESCRVPLSSYAACLRIPKNADWQPFLYDVLMERAVSFFVSGRGDMADASKQMELSQAAALGTAREFMAMNFACEDTTAGDCRALWLWQDWLRFHAKDDNKTAFIYVDLHRLNFAHRHSTLKDKDERYLQQLANIAQTYAQWEMSAQAVFLQAEYWSDFYKNESPQEQEAYKWAKKKAVDLINAHVDNYAAESIGRQRLLGLRALIEKKIFSFVVEPIVPQHSSVLVSMNYRNVKKMHYRVVAHTAKTSLILRYNSDTSRFEHLLSLPVVLSGEWNLPDVGDYRGHTTEGALSGLQAGNYCLLMSERADFDMWKTGILSYSSFQVSDLNYVSGNGKKCSEFYLVHRATGQPLLGVKAVFSALLEELWYMWLQKVVRSDKDGFLKSPAANMIFEDAFFQLSEADKLEDVRFRQSFYFWKASQSEKTYLFTDRAIYRPNQVLYFKGIMLRANGRDRYPRLLANKKTTVTLYDANEQKVASVEVKTNEYGSYQGSFVLPSTGLMGRMSIIDEYTESEKSFSVEEYKRPTFAVQILPIAKAYRLGDTVRIQGIAKGYAGNPIDGVKMRYSMRRVSVFSFDEDEDRFNDNAGTIAHAGDTMTDGKGAFEVYFVPQADAEKQSIYRYSVCVEVTDAAGEMHSQTYRFSVGGLSTFVDLAMPPCISREKGSPIGIDSRNINNEYEPCRGEIVIEALQSPTQIYHERQWDTPDMAMLSEAEFRWLFPNTPYKNEHLPENWAVRKEVFRGKFDTDSSKQINIRSIAAQWEQGAYRVRLSTADRHGEKITLQRTFTLYGETDSKCPVPSALFVPRTTINAEVGDTVQIQFGSSAPNAYVLMRIERAGEVVSTRWIQPKERVSIPLHIEQAHRGGISVQLLCAQGNRFYTQTIDIQVPWTDKSLKISYETFRDKLQPNAQEQWRIRISGSKGEAVAAEVLAAMYDASLDVFAPNDFYFYRPRKQTAQYLLTPYSAYQRNCIAWNDKTNMFYAGVERIPNYTDAVVDWAMFGFKPSDYSFLYDFDDYSYNTNDDAIFAVAGVVAIEGRFDNEYEYSSVLEDDYDGDNSISGRMITSEEIQKLATRNISSIAAQKTGINGNVFGEGGGSNGDDTDDFSDVHIRRNLQETVFFMPQLQTDKNGDILINFTTNEALTAWKFMLLAHTRALACASSSRLVVTQKELMIQPNAPRFFREGDQMEFSAKVANLSQQNIQGKASLQLFDAATMQPVDANFGNVQTVVDFAAAAGQSVGVAWKIQIPAHYSKPVVYRVIAKSANFSDGEESSLPVVSNRILLTESLPMFVAAQQTQDFHFERFEKIQQSTTARAQSYTLEFSQNPAWYAIQALPYLMEYPHECTEQIFSRFYANALASHIANQQPKIRQTFERWKNIDTQALQSNLEKNAELKSALLEETPWVLAAQDEAQQKRNIALLFDLHRMAKEQQKAKTTILQRQLPNGGFAWFPDGEADWYVTQHIVHGFAQLRQMNVAGISDDKTIAQACEKAIAYLDGIVYQQYNRRDTTANSINLSDAIAAYLYTRSLYSDIAITAVHKKALQYYQEQARQHWTKSSLYSQALIALACHQQADSSTARLIVESLRQRANTADSLTMHWNYRAGYRWHESPIETHALMIQLFDEIARDSASVEKLRNWLLQSKQTSHWSTTKATTQAIYALLLRGGGIAHTLDSRPLAIRIGSSALDSKTTQAEAGTGYFKTLWTAEKIRPDMSRLSVSNPNKIAAWGAVHFQYFEQADKVSSANSDLKIRRQLLKEIITPQGRTLVDIGDNAPLRVGERLVVRIEIQTQRDLEYVHLKDLRASTCEPLHTISRREYNSTSRLSYYRSSRDLATHFFIDYLPAGSHVLEYPLRVQQKGNFSNGFCSIQSMYAPEFVSHSEGTRIRVE